MGRVRQESEDIQQEYDFDYSKAKPNRFAGRIGKDHVVIEWREPGVIRVEIHELVIEMKLLERRLGLYEEKYGVLSEDFYNALTSGELADYDAHDESRADFSCWKGIYETLQRRKAAYRKQLEGRKLAELLRVQPAY